MLGGGELVTGVAHRGLLQVTGEGRVVLHEGKRCAPGSRVPRGTQTSPARSHDAALHSGRNREEVQIRDDIRLLLGRHFVRGVFFRRRGDGGCFGLGF